MNKARLLMEQQGKNVSDVMFASGLSWPTCDGVYKAGTWPTKKTRWGTIKAIAEALGVSPVDLISENNKDPA